MIFKYDWFLMWKKKKGVFGNQERYRIPNKVARNYIRHQSVKFSHSFSWSCKRFTLCCYFCGCHQTLCLSPQKCLQTNGKKLRANIVLNMPMLVCCRISFQTAGCQPLIRRRFDMIQTILENLSKWKWALQSSTEKGRKIFRLFKLFQR